MPFDIRYDVSAEAITEVNVVLNRSGDLTMN